RHGDVLALSGTLRSGIFRRLVGGVVLGLLSSLLVGAVRSLVLVGGVVALVVVGGRSFILLADLSDDGTDLDGVVLFGHYLQQNAGNRGGDLGINLVGGHLEQRLIHLYLVANLLQPLGDGALSDRFAQLGHFDGLRHGVEAPLETRKLAVVEF